MGEDLGGGRVGMLLFLGHYNFTAVAWRDTVTVTRESPSYLSTSPLKYCKGIMKFEHPPMTSWLGCFEGVSAEAVGEAAARELLGELERDVCVDSHLQDQVSLIVG